MYAIRNEGRDKKLQWKSFLVFYIYYLRLQFTHSGLEDFPARIIKVKAVQ